MNFKFRLLNTALMSIALSFIMTLYVTWINLGIHQGFILHWIRAWLMAAPAAFFGVLLISTPIAALSKKLLKETCQE